MQRVRPQVSVTSRTLGTVDLYTDAKPHPDLRYILEVIKIEPLSCTMQENEDGQRHRNHGNDK